VGGVEGHGASLSLPSVPNYDGRGGRSSAPTDGPGIHRTYLGSVEPEERNVAIDNICRTRGRPGGGGHSAARRFLRPNRVDKPLGGSYYQDRSLVAQAFAKLR
jgi:hypothetical protein